MPGMAVRSIADLAPDRVRQNLPRLGWDEERIAATRITADIAAAIDAGEIDVVANCTGLTAPDDGLEFPPASSSELAPVRAPLAARNGRGGQGIVEVVSSLHRDGRPVANDLR